MYVVAAVAAALALRRDECREVGLVGRLVGAEPYVAIYAVGAVLDGGRTYRVVERAYAGDDLLHRTIKARKGEFVLALMCIEPVTIVILVKSF